MRIAISRQRPKQQPPLTLLYVLVAGTTIGYLLGSTLQTCNPAVQVVQQYNDSYLQQEIETETVVTKTLSSDEEEDGEEEEQGNFPSRPPLRAKPGSKFAYVFYVTKAEYYCGALVNAYQVIKLGKDPSIDIIILTSTDFQPFPHQKETAENDLNIKHISVSTLPLGNFTNSAGAYQEYYAASMVKLSSFSLYKQGYTRIIFLDADSLILKSLDELFYLPSVGLAAPRAYWIDPGPLMPFCGSATWRPDDGPEVGLQQKFTSALMIVEPSKILWDRLQNKYWPGGVANFTNMFDMDLLNVEFKDDVMLLPGSQLLRLTSDWGPEGRIGNRHIPGNEEILDEEVFNNTFILHFTWGSKIWSIGSQIFEMANPTAHPFAKRFWDMWWEIAGDGNLKCAQVGPDGFAGIILPLETEGNTFTTFDNS
jgi:alpha-N-acetylglucosamine transferase